MNQNRTERFDLLVFVKKRAFILPEKEDLVKNHKSFARRLFSGFLAFCMMFTMASTSMAAYAEELDGEQHPAVISAVEEETAETVKGEQEVDEENPLEEPVPDGQAEEPAVTATPETAQEPLPDLAILDQSAGEQQVPVGEMADLRVKLNRDDVAVEYQWQKLSDPGEETMPGFELFSYAEDAPCTYAYLIDDMSETEWLSENPDASWSGIELYFAVADALDAIGEDCSDVQIVNGTENFALEGYALSAAKTEEGVRVFADLEDSHYTAILNGEGKWQFSQGTVDAADVWQDIDGAAQAVYSHEVTESDAWTLYRCRITITDEAYLAESLARLEEQGVELSENALDAEQVLVSSTFRILPDGWEKCESDETENGEIGLFSTFASLFSAPSGSSGIGISSDTQWITGITGDYEYLSKETYDRIHGQYMLIDGGGKKASQKMYSILKSRDIRHLNVVVGTHPEEDHIGGIPGAFSFADADVTLSPVTEYSTDAFRNFYRYATQKGGGITIPRAGDTYTLGSAVVTILGLNEGRSSNDSSIVLRVDYGATSFLFTGDAEAPEEYMLLQQGIDLSATVLKVGHHGSDTSTTASFLEAASPEVAVVSVGGDNPYGHPDLCVLNSLRGIGCELYRTDLQGDIFIESDGCNLSVTTQFQTSQEKLFAPPQKDASVQITLPEENQVESDGQTSIEKDYVVNRNTGKFHLPECTSVKAMKESNKKFVHESREALLAEGYEPCGRCQP